MVAAALLPAAAPRPALAWEPLRAKTTGTPAHWESPIIPWERANSAAELADDDVDRVLRQGFAAWQEIPCHLLLPAEQPPGQGLGLTVDGHNRIRFVHSGWFGTPLEVAITSATIHDETGRIVDSDMALNDEGYTFVDGGAADPDSIDLRGVLTHELGHFLGLGHSQAPGATMQTYLSAGDVLPLATLEADDVVGLCALAEPAAPLPVQEGRAPAPPGSPLLLAGLGLALAGTRRRSVAPLAFAAALVGASPRCADETVGVTSDAADAGAPADTPADGPLDVGSDGPPDAARDALDASGDAEDAGSAPTDAATTLLSESAWRITHLRTVEEPDGPPVMEAELSDPDAGTVVLAFSADGTVRRAHAVAGAPLRCVSQGTWTADGAELTWSLPTTASYCPSRGAALNEHLRVERDTATGALRLRQLSSASIIGASGRTGRPYVARIEPAGALDVAPCPTPPPPVPCALTCGPSGGGGLAPPVYESTCGTTAPVCEDTADPQTGRLVQRTCIDGCQTITCDIAADGSGSCSLEPDGATCTWEAPQ